MNNILTTTLCVWQIALILRELNILCRGSYFHKQTVQASPLDVCIKSPFLCWQTAERAATMCLAAQRETHTILCESFSNETAVQSLLCRRVVAKQRTGVDFFGSALVG